MTAHAISMSSVSNFLIIAVIVLVLYLLYKLLPLFLEEFAKFYKLGETAVKEFDKDADGLVSRAEFEMFKQKYFEGLESWLIQLDAMFAEYDSDNDGNLDASEFQSLITRLFHSLEYSAEGGRYDGGGIANIFDGDNLGDAVLGDTLNDLIRDSPEDRIMERLLESYADDINTD